MKPDDPSTQAKPEGTQKSANDWWSWIGNGSEFRVIGDEDKYGGLFMAVFMNLLVVGFFFWTIWRLQCGVDCLAPDMILYNNTGVEIAVSLGNDEPTTIEQDSMGRVPQPMAYSFWRRKYHQPYRIRTKNRSWSYEVVEPPFGYEKRGGSRNEYRYQIEANGSIYLLTPESEFPTRNPPPQPSGFPWRPQFGY